MADIKFSDILPDASQRAAIQSIRTKATRVGLELLQLVNERAKWKTNPGEVDRFLQIATTESLTCGLVMATLVDIPWGGFIKYGGFGVYDTDAKRVFNAVRVDDVYTHKCAAEMAVGVLKNSNATIAISVTGNAMPLNSHVDMLGEVFIGIAGYNANDEIIYLTKSINACMETENATMKKTCRKWYSTIKDDGKYNPRDDTASVSQEIRYYTVMKAYELCIEFIRRFNPVVPDAVLERKKRNEQTDGNLQHVHIPPNKFELGGAGICMNYDRCPSRGIRADENVKLYTPSHDLRGGYTRRSAVNQRPTSPIASVRTRAERHVPGASPRQGGRHSPSW